MVRKNISRLFFMVFFIMTLWGLGCDNSSEKESIELRLSYNGLSVKQVQSIPHISIREKKDWGFWGHSTIKHYYEEKVINGDKVVIDRATGLMWHQSGTKNFINQRYAREWVRNLNRQKYASYNDWRLPTVEEAASLLTSDKVNDRYIDPVFDGKQEWIWTGNSYDSKNTWVADFVGGGVLTCNVDDGSYVRPVRSGK